MKLRWLAGVMFVCLLATTTPAQETPTLDGTWVPTSGELDGQKLPDEFLKTLKLSIKGDSYATVVGQEKQTGTLKTDASKKPATIDITPGDGPKKGMTLQAIYDLKGETLTVCYDLAGKERPTEFKGKGAGQRLLLVYQRQK